jgi:hypothetical protein
MSVKKSIVNGRVVLADKKPVPSNAYITYVSNSRLSKNRLVVTDNNTGLLRYANLNISSDKHQPIRVTLSNVTKPGKIINVQIAGRIQDFNWNWTPREPIYVGQDGVLTQVKPESPFIWTRIVAVAETTTTIILIPNLPYISLGSGGEGGSVTSAQFNVLSSRVDTNSAEFISTKNNLSNQVSVLTSVLLAEINNREGGDYLLFDEVSNINSSLLAISASISNTRSAVAANSAQMTSAVSSLNSRFTSVNLAIDTVSNTVSAALNSDIPTLSNNISVLYEAIVQLDSALDNTISVVVANSAQMTSADAALSNRISVLSAVVSNTVSAIAANSAQMISSDAALSSKISATSIIALDAASAVDALSAVVSNALSAIQANSVQAASAHGVISNALSGEIAARISVDLVLNNELSSFNVVLLNNTSAIAANSAQMTSLEVELSSRISYLSAGNFIIENRTSDPVSAVTGRIWLRTDL